MKRFISSSFISMAAALILAGATSAASAVQADDGHVVRASALLSRDGVEAGGTIKAAVLLKIDAAYHINDNAPLDEFMFPTSLEVASEDFEVVETFFPAGKRGKYAYTEVELVVYEGEATLGLLLKAKDGLKPGTYVLKASLGYQACDHTSCLPPKNLAFDIPVTAVAAGAPTKETNAEAFAGIKFRAEAK
jgi:DsbC/DsbD-like thiol-disulfide interchange protein